MGTKDNGEGDKDHSKEDKTAETTLSDEPKFTFGGNAPVHPPRVEETKQIRGKRQVNLLENANLRSDDLNDQMLIEEEEESEESDDLAPGHGHGHGRGYGLGLDRGGDPGTGSGAGSEGGLGGGKSWVDV